MINRKLLWTLNETMSNPVEKRCVNDDEGDWEEVEEELIHVEVSGIVQDDLKSNPSSIKKLVGLETVEPVGQIGNLAFLGSYANCVGTSVFFRQATDTESNKKDLVFDDQPDLELKYLCKAEKKLVLRRVFLNAKKTRTEERSQAQS